MDASPLAFFLSPLGVFYAVTVPFILLSLFALVLIANTQAEGAKTGKVALAAFHYLMQGIGVILMSAGALPTIMSVLGGPPYPGRIYMSLLWVFLIGGALFLWHEQCTQKIERASVVVVHALFVTTVRTMGYVIALLSALSLLLSLALNQFAAQWWVSPVVFFLFGSLLYWSAAESDAAEPAFMNAPLHSAPPKAKKGKKKMRTSWFSSLRLFGKRA